MAKFGYIRLIYSYSLTRQTSKNCKSFVQTVFAAKTLHIKPYNKDEFENRELCLKGKKMPLVEDPSLIKTHLPFMIMVKWYIISICVHKIHLWHYILGQVALLSHWSHSNHPELDY